MQFKNRIEISDFRVDNTKDYEFNSADAWRFCGLLKDQIKIRELEIFDREYGSYSRSSILLWNYLTTNNNVHNKLTAILYSPWKIQNSRVARHLRLKNKQWNFGDGLNFRLEGELIFEDEVVFYGIIDVGQSIFCQIYEIISHYKNGIIFSKFEDESDEISMVKELLQSVKFHDKNDKINVNPVEAINYLIDQNRIVYLPFDWQEVGSYHLGIFSN